ncbi:E2/UBC family protein [Robertmurraya sp. P23]|uniref:E2/UBC family protein n=1 Tax=Robertmurraya sp. P23 TaxID=3436931 RepID=UPI003D986592
MRREFSLPEEDTDFLNSREWKWESIIEGSNRWIIIHDFPVPKGYNVSFSKVAVQILSGYPNSHLDMAYFYPWLSRTDGIQIGQADQQMIIWGQSFQRWSRHYEWKPGIHSLTTHLLSVEDWLEREFYIKPSQGVRNV